MDIHWQNANSFAHFHNAGLYMLGFDPKEDKNLTGQMEFPGYEFDNRAHEATIMKLSDDIPTDIYKRNIKNIPLIDLYSQHCNHTPANKEIFKEALQPAMDDKDIEIIGEKGEKRRKSSAVKDSDIIKQTAQRKFSFSWSS